MCKIAFQLLLQEIDFLYAHSFFILSAWGTPKSYFRNGNQLLKVGMSVLEGSGDLFGKFLLSWHFGQNVSLTVLFRDLEWGT